MSNLCSLVLGTYTSKCFQWRPKVRKIQTNKYSARETRTPKIQVTNTAQPFGCRTIPLARSLHLWQSASRLHSKEHASSGDKCSWGVPSGLLSSFSWQCDESHPSSRPIHSASLSTHDPPLLCVRPTPPGITKACGHPALPPWYAIRRLKLRHWTRTRCQESFDALIGREAQPNTDATTRIQSLSSFNLTVRTSKF